MFSPALEHPDLVSEPAREAFSAGTLRSLFAGGFVYLIAVGLAFVSPSASLVIDALAAVYFATSRSQVPGLISRAARVKVMRIGANLARRRSSVA